MKKLLAIFVSILFVSIVISISTTHAKAPKHDKDYDKQWGLNNDGTQQGIELDADLCSISEFMKGMDIEYQGMWDVLSDKKPKRDVIVALIDTGIDFTNKDLAGTQWINRGEIANNGVDDDANGYIDDINGWNFVDETNKITSPLNSIDDMHGTMCAGIIAGIKNGNGIEGVTRGIGVRIMSLKIISNEYTAGEGEISKVVQAIKYAEKMGAAVCNMSFNAPGFDTELYEEMKKSSMLFIVSAGNSDDIIRLNVDKKQFSPASFCLSNQITVANLGFDGKPYRDTNIGSRSVDLAAPGTCIYSTAVNGQLQYATGTSYAAPFVTGVASMVYRYSENPTAQKIKQIICGSVTNIESLKGRVRSGGMLNAEKALNECMGINKEEEKQ
jgi:subtilisin family serine protease